MAQSNSEDLKNNNSEDSKKIDLKNFPKSKSEILKKIISVVILFVAIPLTVTLGVWLFMDRKYNVISLIVAFLSCVPFFIRFEKGKNGVRELVVIAVMTAFSIIGRLIFAPLPGFKPVTAITVISGIALGPEAGFLVGSLTAVVSDFFFGQGPWTPFQMFSWGVLGFLSGVLFFKKEKPNKIMVCLLGAVGGVIFSLIMDIWTTLSLDGIFLWTRYLVNVVSALPFMAIYAISNVIFLLVLTEPFLSKLNRLKKKYNLFNCASGSGG